jgi:hypothetical protein
MTMQRYMHGLSNGGVISAATGEVLDNTQLRAVVPSLFAREAHESRSARFAPIPTIDVIDGLRREGFDPFFAQQARTRIAGKGDYTKHMVRLRHRSLARADGEAFEIILVNANDGTSAYQMLPGFFRFVCANGLFTGDTFNEIKVRHSGNAISEVIEGAYEVLSEAPRVTEQVGEAKGLRLTEQERRLFAESAHMLRFPEAHVEAEDERKEAPVAASKLLTPRRYADGDIASTLWGTFNIVQENTIKGGLAGRITGSNGRRRNATTRPVAGIDQNRALNRAMWNLMSKMAELKAAA